MQEFITAMENQAGEMCFLYFFNIMGYYYAEYNKSWKIICGLIYRLYLDNTGLFMTDSVYCSSTKSKKKKKKERRRRRHPGKVGKTGVLPSTSILNF